MRKLILLLFILPAIGCADGLPTTPYIYVQGSASATVAPDTLTIDFVLSETNMDQTKAKLTISERSSTVFKMLKELGLVNSAVTSYAIRSRAKFDYRSSAREFTGYLVQRDFSVKLTDFNVYPKLLDGLFSLRADEIRGVTPSSSKEAMQSDKLFTAALRDAREKAEKIAGELNAKVASVFAVSPIAFGGIKDILFGHEEIDLPNGAALDKFVVTGSPLTDKGDRYSFEPLNLSQRLHVIFLIEPARK